MDVLGLIFLLIFAGHCQKSAAQSTCDAIANNNRDRKWQYLVDCRLVENAKSMEKEFNLYYYEDKFSAYGDYDKDMLHKYYEDFDGIRRKFDVKIQILNETASISEVIKTQTALLEKHMKDRKTLKDNFYSSEGYLDYIYEKFGSGITIDDILSFKRCEPCLDNAAYTNCTNEEVLVLKNGAENLQRMVQNFVKEASEFDEVKRWDFLNNARRAAKETFNSLKKVITVQQVNEYYKNELASEYGRLTKQEGRWNNVPAGGTTILKTLQFVFDGIDEPDSKCVRSIQNIINTIKSYVDALPVWEFDEMVAKYGRKVSGNVDLLIDVLEDVLSLVRKFESDKLKSEFKNVYDNRAPELLQSVERLNALTVDCKEQTQVTNRKAADVFECFKQILNQSSTSVAEYLQGAKNADKFLECYNKSL